MILSIAGRYLSENKDVAFEEYELKILSLMLQRNIVTVSNGTCYIE